MAARPFDRDARLARARAEGRQARGLGPAIGLQYFAGGLALLIGGFYSLEAFDRALGGYLGQDDFQAAATAVAFLAVGAGQLYAARVMARRLALARRGEANDGSLANACIGGAVAAGLHCLFPLGVFVAFLADTMGAPGARFSDPILEVAGCLLPFELIPLAALLATIRAWKLVVGDHAEDAVDQTVPAAERKRQRIERDRQSAAFRSGTLTAAAGALAVLIGGMAASSPLSTGPYPQALNAVLVALGLNGLLQFVTGGLLMGMPRARLDERARIWSLALGGAAICMALVFLALLLPSLGGARWKGPISNIGHVGRTGLWIILAEAVPAIVLGAVVRGRWRVRELRAEAGA